MANTQTFTPDQLTDDVILDAAARELGRRPDRIADRRVAHVKFAWHPARNLDPLNFSDWYHVVLDLQIRVVRP